MSRTPKRDRGVVLTQQGVERIKKAIASAQDEEKFGKRFTQAELSERANLSIKTIKKILERTRATDEGSIRLLFDAFGLELAASDYGVPEASEAISSRLSPSETKTALSPEERLSLIRSLNALPLAQFEEIVFALNLPRGIVATGIDAQGNRAKALLDWAEGPTGCGIDEVLNLLAKYIPLETIRTPQNDQEPAVSSKSAIIPIALTSPQSPSLDTDVAPKIDWGEKPDTAIFFGRTEELTTLDQWVTTEQCRVVTLLGMGGIGKTSLVAKLADQIYEQFDYVIWRSLREAPPLDEILVRLIQFLSDQQETEINLPSRLGERIIRLLNYLREHRCLLVLDNLESILQAESAGQFRDGYEGYGELIRRIGEGEHQSCLLLTSRECPRQLAPMAGDRLPVRLWSVTGIDPEAGREILKAKGLDFDDADIQGQKLINRYSGNPQALHLVATAIQREFLGDVDDFLKEERAIVEDVRSLLDQHLTRLAPLERSILFWLAINREPVGLDELMEDLLPPVTKREVRSALGDLSDRYLIETVGKCFTLQNVIMEFSTDRFVELVSEELNTHQFDLFYTHALIKATAKDYVRETQFRLILKPIGISVSDLDGQVNRLLKITRQHLYLLDSYMAGNLLNLLCSFRHEVLGFDFSDQILRQVYLEGKKLYALNLSRASFIHPSFTRLFGRVLSVATHPREKLVAAGDSKGQIRLWNIDNPQNFVTLKGHTDLVSSVAFNPNGQQLATGSSDMTVKLWNIRNNQCVHTFTDYNNAVWSIAFSLDGRWLVASGRGGKISIWDLQKHELLHVFYGHTDTVWSLAFHNESDLLASCGKDETVRLWSIRNRRCNCVLSPEKSPNQ
jgi:transcriptional regulator with XRE-family HTH domain